MTLAVGCPLTATIDPALSVCWIPLLQVIHQLLQLMLWYHLIPFDLVSSEGMRPLHSHASYLDSENIHVATF